MSRFLIIFFSIYGAMHAYAFFKARRGLSLKIIPSFLLLLFMLFMVTAPVLVRMAEREGMETIPLFLAFAAYIWMGLLFFFLAFSLIFDFCRLLLYIYSQLLKKQPPTNAFLQRKFFYLSCGLALLVSFYSFYEAQDFSMERIVIETEKLPEAAAPIKIVQISDLHIGLIIRAERVRQLADMIRKEAPDILVATGDIIDGQSTPLDGISGLFAEIRPPHGKYAILGNHEYYVGLEESLVFLKNAEFKVLRGEAVNAAEHLIIAGVDDEAVKRFDEGYNLDEKKLLSSIPAESFTLLLKHRPVIAEGSTGLFDLQLSGHTHKGQIFPFNFVVRRFYPYIAGMVQLSERSWLYTSRGTGTWGPPMRFLAPPEITVIELRGKKN